MRKEDIDVGIGIEEVENRWQANVAELETAVEKYARLAEIPSLDQQHYRKVRNWLEELLQHLETKANKKKVA